MLLEPVNIIQIIFFTQCCFGVVLIINKPQYRGLLYLLIATALLMAFNLLEETRSSYSTHLVTPVFSLAYGPLFYLFVYKLVYCNVSISHSKSTHFLPTLIALPFTDSVQSILFLGTVSQLIYLTVCFRLVLHYHKATFSSRSDAYSLKLSWVIKVLVAIIILEIVDLTRLNLQPYLPLDVLKTWYFIMQTAFFLLVSTLIYKAVHQPALFQHLSQFDVTPQSTEATQANSEDRHYAQLIFNELDKHLKNSTLYRQPRLSLRDLANHTSTSEKEISWAINLISKKNFCDYINSLRVSDVKQQILKNLNITCPLIDIALRAGFNSKSTFNAAFKRETGLTPSEFIKTNQPTQ